MFETLHLSQFKRDYRRVVKRRWTISQFTEIVKLLTHEQPLPKKYRDHALSGNWKHHRELHIEPDWLLIYQIAKKENILILVRTGTHADLF